MKQDALRRTRAFAPRLAAFGGTALKVAVWIVAVPALCLVVGAAPLYLLLPKSEPTPPAGPVLASAARPAPAADASKPKPEPATQAASADPAPVGSIAPPAKSAPATVEAATAAPQEDADAPEESDADPLASPDAVAAIPTPRPAPPPVAAEAPVADPAPDAKPPVRVAAVEPPKPAPSAKLEAKAQAGGGNAVIVRSVTLRAAPWGRELGTLDGGTSVSVGQCAEWCEVRAAGIRGWVHSSFIAGAAQRRPDADAKSRPADRRIAADERAARQAARDARAEARAAERRRYAEDMDDPDWFIDDDRPVVIERRRAPPRPLYYLPDDYIPY